MMEDMKTTVEIPDALLREAKNYAAAHGLTVRILIEDGLRSVLAAGHLPKPPYRLTKRHAFKGRGLRTEMDWPTILETVYEGRGGRAR